MTRDSEPLNPNPSDAWTVATHIYSLHVEPDNTGMRLDKWLSVEISALTRTRLKSLIEAGAVMRNGLAVTDPSTKIREGDDFCVTVPQAADPEPKGEAIPLEVDL